MAEIHLPRSGIELLIDGVPFPRFGPYIDRAGFTFLAVCSIRRLLNRIHNTIYSIHPGNQAATSPLNALTNEITLQKTSSPKIDNLDHVCQELARQMNSWYDSLPSPIRLNLQTESPTDLLDGWLKLRYWSTKHIIYRPWVLFVSSLEGTPEVSTEIMNNCEVCIISCRQYIRTAAFTLSHQSQYTWQTLQA